MTITMNHAAFLSATASFLYSLSSLLRATITGNISSIRKTTHPRVTYNLVSVPQ
ncbi:hypothetical protein GF336_06490 [Candidatus Woesearchaeota archaeon]|nr:hypothetical protein [Candidatus Woesearchaeota archaeon]